MLLRAPRGAIDTKNDFRTIYAHTLSNDLPLIEGYWREYELNDDKLPSNLGFADCFSHEQRCGKLKQGRFCVRAPISAQSGINWAGLGEQRRDF
jgi:hypothetical protein